MSPLYILEREETLAEIIQITQSHFSPHYDIYLMCPTLFFIVEFSMKQKSKIVWNSRGNCDKVKDVGM